MSISYVPGTALCTGDTAMNILIAEKQKITKKLINHEENTLLWWLLQDKSNMAIWQGETDVIQEKAPWQAVIWAKVWIKKEKLTIESMRKEHP